MNHCLNCNSRYEKPGTCNCFAPSGKRAVAAEKSRPQPFDDETFQRLLREAQKRPVPAQVPPIPGTPISGIRCAKCGNTVGMFEVHPCYQPTYTLAAV